MHWRGLRCSSIFGTKSKHSVKGMALRKVPWAAHEALRAPGHGQILCSEDNKALDHLQRHIGHLPAPGQAVKHGIERDSRLQAGQGSAQAEMNAMSEGDVSIRLALN